MITRSSLAVQAVRQRDVDDRTRPVFGVAVHTTGSGIVNLARRLKVDPLEKAVAYYENPDNYFPAYVIGYDGTIIQIADEKERAQHIGFEQRSSYLDGSWKTRVPPEVVTMWKARWPQFKSPAHLFPGSSPNNCVVPETRLLSADLEWVEAGACRVGDSLIAFPENLGHHMKLQHSVVVRSTTLRKSCVRIVTTHGDLVSSVDHLWVAKRPYGKKRRSGRKNSYGPVSVRATWVPAGQVRVGDRLLYFTKPWTSLAHTWSAGYLAGLYDGEGSVGSRQGEVCLSQNEGLVLDRARRLLSQAGFSYSPLVGSKKCKQLYLTGDRASMRLLGTIRPVRLLQRSAETWEGRRIFGRNTEKPLVLAVEPAGEQWVSAVQTSTGTFIAEGFLSHNCYIGIEMLPVANDLYGMAPWSQAIWKGWGKPQGFLYTLNQHQALLMLAKDIAERWSLPIGWHRTGRLCTHEDVNPIARHTKKPPACWDPGIIRPKPWFDWNYLLGLLD